MFGLSHNRRKPKQIAPVVRRAAAWEPLESRQLLSGTLLPAADAGLTVTVVKSTVQKEVLTGANIKGAITLQLTNSGTTSDTGSNSFVVYASADAVVDSTDRVIANVAHNFNVKAGKTLKYTIPVKSQAAPVAGSYDVLVAVTDAANVTTTTQVEPAPALVVAPANVVLTATVGNPAPTALIAGRTFTVRTTLTNGGNTNSVGTLTTAVGLSTDGTNVTFPLVSKMRKATIKAGFKALALTFKVKIPAGTPAGTYTVALTATQGSSQTIAFSSIPITVGSA